jgi:hypothetical protein
VGQLGVAHDRQGDDSRRRVARLDLDHWPRADDADAEVAAVCERLQLQSAAKLAVAR